MKVLSYNNLVMRFFFICLKVDSKPARFIEVMRKSDYDW